MLPLTQEQFLQVILLAQNRFARFLLATHGERQALLRTLFGTRRFEEYEHALEQRRKESEARVARDGDTLAHRLDDAERLIEDHHLGGEDAGGEAVAIATQRVDDTGVRIDAVRQAAQRAAYRAETAALEQEAARVARDAAEVALADVIARRDLQQRRDRARHSVAALEADAARIQTVRDERDTATRGELAREGIRALKVARAETERANDARLIALSQWRERAAPGDADGRVAEYDRTCHPDR